MLNLARIATTYVNRIRTLPRNQREQAILREVAGYPGGAAIATALLSTQLSDHDQAVWLAPIERERARLRATHAPLADGTLGPPHSWDVTDTVSQADSASKARRPAELIYRLTRAVRPLTVLELGTNVGISTAYVAQALTANGRGHIVTMDMSRYRQRVARSVWEGVGVSARITVVTGTFTDTLPAVLRDHAPIDLAFIDGDHQYAPTLAYFDAIYQVAPEGAVFVFDDIRWSAGMLRAWEAVQHDPRVGIAVDCGSMGIATAAFKGQPRYVTPRLYSVIKPYRLTPAAEPALKER